MDEYMGR